MKLRLVRIALLCALGYAAYAGVVWTRQTDIVFPGRTRPAEAPTLAAEAASVRLNPDDTAQHARLFRTTTPNAPLVAMAHGNGELISDWFAEAIDLQSHGFHVLLVEYPGYGGLPGKPGQAAIRSAFEAGLDAALEHLAPSRPRVMAWAIRSARP